MKYNNAYFQQDNSEVWQAVEAKHLFNNIDLIASLRKHKLFEHRNDTNQLFIRNRKDCPHFYSRGLNRKKVGFGKESIDHQKRINLTFEKLNSPSTKKVQLGYSDYTDYDKNLKNRDAIRFEAVKTLTNYKWGVEINYPINESQHVVFDILGRHNDLHWTENKPFLAIEVVDTHFTDLEVFKELLILTKKQPLVIAYIFVKDTSYCYPPDSKINHETFKITTRYYMQDGSFWTDDERLEEKYQVKECDLNNPVDYYNFLMEKIVKKCAYKQQ